MEEKKSHEIVLCLYSQRGSKRRRREEIEIILNDDMLEEIMVRLPGKTLIICETVSKHWRRIITSKSFKKRYMLHQKTQEPKFLFLYGDKDWYQANIALKTMTLKWSSTCLVEEDKEDEYHTVDEHEEEKVFVSNSLDGLVCFCGVTDLKARIRVINPATRWSQFLPLAGIQQEDLDNKETLPLPGFGKDLVTGTYKLVWLHNINDKDTSSCEVFDFGVKQWRHVIPPPPDHRIDYDHEPTFANGWLYWFSEEKTKLIAFDLHMEMFRVVPNPISNASASLDMHMGSIDDDRSLVWISETNGDGIQHVWRLINHNTRRGELSIMDKMFSFELNKINSTWFDDPDCSYRLKLTAISKNGHKVMLSNSPSQSLLLCQPLKPNSILYREFSYSPSRPSDSIHRPYFPSLASPL